MPAISSVHFNRNLLAAVDTETTGLTPGKHEIVQLCVVPLAPDLTPSKEFRAFELRIKPENTHWIAPDYNGLNRKLIQDCMIHGMERWAAVDYFGDWFYKTLRLANGKKIVPLGCNYESFDFPFLVEFLGGYDSYGEFFRSDVRDVQRLACGINDMADWHSQRIPFPKVNLSYLAACLKVVNENPHNALNDAMVTAEVYRRMLNVGMHYTRMPVEGTELAIETLGAAYGAYCVETTKLGRPPMGFPQFKSIWEQSFEPIS